MPSRLFKKHQKSDGTCAKNVKDGKHLPEWFKLLPPPPMIQDAITSHKAKMKAPAAVTKRRRAKPGVNAAGSALLTI